MLIIGGLIPKPLRSGPQLKAAQPLPNAKQETVLAKGQTRTNPNGVKADIASLFHSSLRYEEMCPQIEVYSKFRGRRLK
jgi:hypothetical protein